MALVDDAARLIKAMTPQTEKGSGVTARGRVIAVDGKTAWVSIAGGYSRTPCEMAVKCLVGDTVSVLIHEGRATVTANITSPSTDDSTANAAYRQSDEAMEQALQVYSISMAAQVAASRAVNDAAEASLAAASASSAAAAAQASADSANTAAQTAQGSADAAGSAATSALSNAAEAVSMATSAQGSAAAAAASASAANEYAKGAMFSVSEVEQIVGTLNWISEHGTYLITSDTTVSDSKVYYELEGGSYALTADTSVKPNKQYYVSDGSGGYTPVKTPSSASLSSYYERSNYTATQVLQPTVSGLAGYFELYVDESVQNYIASHLAQTDYGLNLMVDGSSFHANIGTADGKQPMGLHVIDANGAIVGSFSSSGATMGNVGGIHAELIPVRFSFMSPGYHLPEYQLTEDTTVQTGKIYYEYDSASDTYSIADTSEPGYNPAQNGLYEPYVFDSASPVPGEVAYIAVDQTTQESMFYMSRAVVVKDLRFGNWKWADRENGNMALKWMG